MPSTRLPLDDQAGLYEKGIGKANEYTLVPGVCVLPLAEDPPTDPTELAGYSPVVVLRLHAPYRIRRVSYRSEKVNNPPVLPAPQDQGAFVFLGGDVSVVTVLNASLVNYDWTVATDYRFVENCVSRTQDGFVLGSYQVPTAMSAQNAESVGMNLFGPSPAGNVIAGGVLTGGAPPSVISPGAVGYAGVDAQTGFRMGQSIDFYGRWGYNQDAFLPGELFNARLINGNLDPTRPT